MSAWLCCAHSNLHYILSSTLIRAVHTRAQSVLCTPADVCCTRVVHPPTLTIGPNRTEQKKMKDLGDRAPDALQRIPRNMGTSLMRNRPPPLDYHRALGIAPKGRRFLVSEVPLTWEIERPMRFNAFHAT